MSTTFACKPGQYYVRCIIFNSEGESNEIVSNSVTTSVSCLTFDYEGKPAIISLPQGQYMLEVWGAKGGDSAGSGRSETDCRGNSTVKGGLGGYSRGIISLNKNETFYIFVGEAGHPSNSEEGSSTKGGYPDGGGTRTGYCNQYHTIPGTGGGSTSIRIGTNSDNTRVIVAGGGGGASGDCWYANSGGYGGGYGGFGGHGWCSSGGGGSGWTFTDSSLKTFQSGDSENSSKFALTSEYYLRESKSFGGNEEFPRPDGNGNEKGHSGNGYAKITFL